MPSDNLLEQLIANQIDVDSLGNASAVELTKIIDEAREDVFNSLKKRASKTGFTAIRERELLRQMDHALADLLGDFNGTLNKNRIAIVKREFNSITKALRKEGGLTLDPLPRLPIKQIEQIAKSKVLGKTTLQQLGGIKNALVKKARVALGKVVAAGGSVQKAGNVLRETFGLSRDRANITARTAMLDSAMKARDEAYKRNEDAIESYTFLATLDSRTCPICGLWDNTTEKERGDLPTPPLHPRCRCFIRPNTKTTESVQRPAIFEQERRTVNHRDGSTSTKFTNTDVGTVSDKTSYQQFFKKQPAAWQREVLGKTRYELLRDGKIKFDDLVGGTFTNQRILTLKQLEKLIDD